MTMMHGMTPANADMHTDRLVDDSRPEMLPSALEQGIQAIKNLLLPHHKELITQLRQPTPMKVTTILTTTAAGTLGTAVATPDFSSIVYRNGMGSEAWLHRISISSPSNTPGNPITGLSSTATKDFTSTISNPAAGAQFSSPFGFGTNVTILSIQFTLTTSATVANRLVQVTLNGTNYAAGVAQTASLVETYNFFPGAPLTTVLPATGGTLWAPIPPGIIIPPGSGLASLVTNLAAGDQLSAISFLASSNSGAIGSTTGPELLLYGATTGEPILLLPEGSGGFVVPFQAFEGRIGAPHLDRGETILVAADGLPASTPIRFDLQLIETTGASEFTPRRDAPTDLNKVGQVEG